jgi:hypothetical protein
MLQFKPAICDTIERSRTESIKRVFHPLLGTMEVVGEIAVAIHDAKKDGDPRHSIVHETAPEQ